MILPLQTQYLTEGDPLLAAVLFGVLAVGIIILIGVNASRNGISTGMRGAGGGTRFHRFAHRKAATAFGLNADQTALLEDVFRKAQVGDTAATLRNPALMDKYLRKAYRDIDSSAATDADAELSKSLLFSIRSSVESAAAAGGAVSSTRKIAEGQPTVLATPDGTKYPVRIVSAKGDELLMEVPKTAVGTPVALARGTRVSVSFYAKTNMGYRFETKVRGVIETGRGQFLALAHTERVSTLPNRRHKRKEARLACYFSLARVFVRQKGRKKVNETIVDSRKFMGTIMDISAGGCSIKTASPLKSGEYIKMEFDDVQGRTHAAFGRLVRTNRTGGVGGVMHVQFLKTTRKALNAINAYVFGYDQD